MSDGARQTIVCSYSLDLGLETEPRIQVREVLFDDAYLSKVIDDKKSQYRRIEVLDLIYHRFFLTANSLGGKPTTSELFQPLTPQILAVVARLFIVRSLSLPLENKLQLCFLKMNIKVNFTLPR